MILKSGINNIKNVIVRLPRIDEGAKLREGVNRRNPNQKNRWFFENFDENTSKTV